ncbi:hypothetical protein BDZ91DRAFT_727994 [Kalaharituber pfeilii]|nr:hypothetical protein BDZ91DRAFT_727994 [Kalaharituber pfeilii]
MIFLCKIYITVSVTYYTRMYLSYTQEPSRFVLDFIGISGYAVGIGRWLWSRISY